MGLAERVFAKLPAAIYLQVLRLEPYYSNQLRAIVMGLDTQAVLRGHVSADRVSGFLRDEYGVVATVRATHSKDYWMIEFVDSGGLGFVVNVFANSYAAADYQDLGVAESTLLTMEFGPTSRSVLETLASKTGGWLRSSDGAPWIEIAG